MQRHRVKDDNENHGRWLISYSDFVTLLLALFVVLYAISHVNEGKYRMVAESLGSAFRNPSGRALVALDKPASGITPSQNEPAPDYLAGKKARRLAEAERRRQEKMENIAQQMAGAFDAALDNGSHGKVSVSRSNAGIRVEIDASLLFAPGQAELSEDSQPVLEAVATVLKNADQAIQIEGHTDAVPISTGRFPSNWELSTSRASAVVRLLIANGVDAARLGATGYADTRPLESNESEEGRRRNRRVTVMILSGEPENPAWATGREGPLPDLDTDSRGTDEIEPGTIGSV